MKVLKQLKFTDINTSYAACKSYVALGKIDKKIGICESRKSEDVDLAVKYGVWRKCLEEAAKNWGNSEKDKSLIFVHEPGEHEKVAGFICSFEKLLSLKENGIGSIVFPTDKNTVSAIRVSPFWRECPMRRRLFLILMRAGRTFNLTENLWDCMMRDNLLKPCRPALELFFLENFVYFSQACVDRCAEKASYGFNYQFNDLKKEDIKDIKLFNNKDAVLKSVGPVEPEEEFDEAEPAYESDWQG